MIEYFSQSFLEKLILNLTIYNKDFKKGKKENNKEMRY